MRSKSGVASRARTCPSAAASAASRPATRLSSPAAPARTATRPTACVGMRLSESFCKAAQKRRVLYSAFRSWLQKEERHKEGEGGGAGATHLTTARRLPLSRLLTPHACRGARAAQRE